MKSYRLRQDVPERRHCDANATGDFGHNRPAILEWLGKVMPKNRRKQKRVIAARSFSSCVKLQSSQDQVYFTVSAHNRESGRWQAS